MEAANPKPLNLKEIDQAEREQGILAANPEILKKVRQKIRDGKSSLPDWVVEEIKREDG